jgi:hypothetical protein
MMSAIARRARDLGANSLSPPVSTTSRSEIFTPSAPGARRCSMSADGIEWLAAEGN